MKELLEYLVVSDVEFKADLAHKIVDLVKKFSPSKRWHVETFVRVLEQAGAYVEDRHCHQFLALVSQTPELQVRAGPALQPVFSSLTPCLVRICLAYGTVVL